MFLCSNNVIYAIYMCMHEHLNTYRYLFRMNHRRVRVGRDLADHLFPNSYHGLVMFLSRKYLIWYLNGCENHC